MQHFAKSNFIIKTQIALRNGNIFICKSASIFSNPVISWLAVNDRRAQLFFLAGWWMGIRGKLEKVTYDYGYHVSLASRAGGLSPTIGSRASAMKLSTDAMCSLRMPQTFTKDNIQCRSDVPPSCCHVSKNCTFCLTCLVSYYNTIIIANVSTSGAGGSLVPVDCWNVETASLASPLWSVPRYCPHVFPSFHYGGKLPACLFCSASENILMQTPFHTSR